MDNGPPGAEVLIAPITLILIISGIYEGIYLSEQWKASILEKEQLKRENIASQLEGLRSQVNPHFLFNSLNTLAYMIPEDADQSVKFVQKLSKVYRYILEIRDKQLISIAEEINFLHSYVFLLRERFGENLCVTIEVPEYIYQAKILPLSMQLLFENAIKHNVISQSKPLHIRVYLENGKLIVSNNFQPKRQTGTSTKVGLQNIKNRYAFFTSKEVEILAGENEFSVHLPILSPQKSALIEQ